MANSTRSSWKKVAGEVGFKSARTDMQFSKLNGDLDMDSGDLRANDLVGPFRLLTRSKDVRLNGVDGDVRLENENGAVEIHLTRLGNMQLSNRNSDVQIYIPDKAGFQLDVVRAVARSHRTLILSRRIAS